MKKYNLPVIVLNGLVLLPNNTLKLEYDETKKENSVIDMSMLFHDGYVLLTTRNDSLSSIAVVGKIQNKLELPNGNVRIDILALRRVKVLEYIESSSPLESIVSDINEKVDSEKEELLLKKISKELKMYIKSVPYISNSILTNLDTIKELRTFVDVVVPNLGSSQEKIYNYLIELNPINRAEMLLKDIYQEKEMFAVERDLDLKVKKEMDDNQREYILREKMKKIKEELGDSSSKDSEIDILKKRINDINAPKKIKERLDFEIKRFESMTVMTPEVNVTRDYIEWLLDLPWELSTMDNENLNDVKNKLNASHYGIDDVKARIIEYLAVKQNTNTLKGPIICLTGPPGVGKTSLAFSIAKAINRNFVKISASGIKDTSEIMGHRKAYVGSSPGRIITQMKVAQSNNPLFLIDEIDKMNRDYMGDPTTSLLSVLDPEQNKYFSDNYIEENFDLSNVMFILTANNIDEIPDPLRDRLEIINLSGYTEFEKLDIAKKHLIPKICLDNGLDNNYLIINDEVLLEIIRDYTKEAGVRELERQLTKLVRKIVTQLVVNKIKMNKIVINRSTLIKYLGNTKHQHSKIKSEIGVVNGLAYTTCGGDTLPIEVNYYKGSGKLVLTGSLGDVMKESASIALSYIKSNYKYFKIDYNKLIENDIHIHVPEGAIKKEGPSAGIALTLALISALTETKIDSKLALTGEITLRGQVLAIGGLKEKSVGALRNGIKKIIIPEGNSMDISELPKEVRDNIEFIKVKNFKEVMEVINEKN